VGLHPELVGERHAEADLLLQLISATRFVGEVGLDSSPQHARDPPARRVRELWCTVGRRSGKSRIAAALAVYAAAFVPHRLAPGEVGTVLVLAASTAQARVVFEYCRGFFEASPVLRRELASTTASEIRLDSGVVIAVHPNSYRTVRGKTLLACIMDEVAIWRDAESALPDIETYRAVLPSLVTTNGMLIGISSPYRKTGLLYQKHRDHFGQPGDDVLVIQGASRQFNPTLDEEVIAAASASDPEAAVAEWGGEFRADIASFLDEETVEAAIDRSRPPELPPRSGTRYQAFADPSGGRHDSFTLCIGHRLGDGFVADVVRGRAPPFDPSAVVAEYAALLKQYRITMIAGDNYSAEWAVSSFKEDGIRYVRSEQNKSQLYLEALPLFMRRAILIPDHPRLIRELRLLERRVGRVGRDTIDHPKNGSDDHANALCGMLRACAKPAWDWTYSSPAWDGLGGSSQRGDEVASDAARKSVEDAYREYVDRVSTWRGPPPRSAGTSNRTIPVTDQSSDARAAAYADYENYTSRMLGGMGDEYP
jgi:hypothetical protein